jgi:ribosomal protein S6--L-glutamate ligase
VVPSHLPTTLIAANTSNSADEIFYQMLMPFVAKTPKSSMGDGVIDAYWRFSAYCLC